MTVCIAALYDNGKGGILAADQMTTAHIPIGYEFESNEVEKIVQLRDSVYVLISGDVLFAHEIIRAAKELMTERNADQVAILAELVRCAYQDVRRRYVIQTQLEPRWLGLDSYYGSQQKLITAIVQMIDQSFLSWNPGTDLVVAGKDASDCHIYTVHNPGVMTCHDPIGFVAIGSGGPHATYSLIESEYKKSLGKETVEDMVEKAKARSEVAPGVGKATTKVFAEG